MKASSSFLLLCAFAALATSLPNELHARCVGKQGETILTDRRCEDSGGTWVGPARDNKPSADEARAANQRFAKTKPPITAERSALIGHCERKWPADFRMQAYCTDQQTQAAKQASFYVTYVDSLNDDQLRLALAGCTEKWKDGDTWDYRMVVYCFEQQKEALERMRAERGQ